MLSRLWNIWFYQWAMPAKIVSVCVLAALLLAVVFGVRSCGKREVKIDQEAINKINSANRAEREAELKKVIDDNADVVRTNDNRTAIADANVEQRNAEIDAKVKAADKAVEDAKRQGRDVTSDELECILVPENCK